MQARRSVMVERNARIAIIFVLLQPIFAQISFSPKSVDLKDVAIEYEETPFVPMVFFAGGSSNIDSRFDSMLKELAERSADNPDVIIEIRGYYHKMGDGVSNNGKLCRDRAESVRKRILEFEPGISGRVLVQPAIDPTKLRRGDFGSRDIAIQQENQRAEISARIDEPIALTISSSDPKNAIEQIEREHKLYRIERLLADNPLLFVVIEGMNVGSMREPEKSLEKLFRIKNALTKKLDKPYLSSRIFVALRWDESESENIRLSVCSDWIIHKPISRSNVSANHSDDKIKIDARKNASDIKIFRSDGTKIADVPKYWNLSSIPEPLWIYFASSLVKTSAGHFERIWSKPITFKFKKVRKCTERFIIGNYELNRLRALDAQYSFANRYKIAEKIVRLAAHNRDGKLKITALGYTDDTGDDERNRQMSQLWANKEIDEIERLLVKPELYKIDGFKKMCEIEFSAVGKGNSSKSGSASSFTFDESEPEERIAKRRVEILIEVVK